MDCVDLDYDKIVSGVLLIIFWTFSKKKVKQPKFGAVGPVKQVFYWSSLKYEFLETLKLTIQPWLTDEHIWKHIIISSIFSLCNTHLLHLTTNMQSTD